MRKFLLHAAAPLALVACVLGTTADAQVASRTTAISPAERQQGSQAHPGIVAQFGGAYTGPQAAYVTRIGQRIAVRSGLGAAANQYTVTLLNSPVNNALAIPGGYVYVTRQLVALMNDEAELAAVLGHEVSHVAARHSASRQSVAQRNSLLGTLGQVLVGAVAGNSQIGRVLSQSVGTGSQLATLGFSRGQETQADDLAVRYLAQAGYDPVALSTVLRSLAAQESLDQRISGNVRTLPPWASTHPNPAARVQRAATQARNLGARGERNREVFLAAINGMMYGDDPRQGVVEGRDFLHPEFRLAFTIPQGFTMQNGADAVTISGPNAQAQFRTAPYNGNLESYVAAALRAVAGNSGASVGAPVQRTTINGVPAAYSQTRATTRTGEVDVTVVAYATAANRAYHFVIVTPAGRGIGAMDSMIESFRTLSASQAAAVRPRFVRVVAVRAGDTPASLAARMAFADYRLERFLVLNGLTENATLSPGQRVKIVTY